MNPYLAEYVETAKKLAKQRGLIWTLDVDGDGKVRKASRWNLTAVAGMLPPPNLWLGQVGVDEASFAKLNATRLVMGLPLLPARPMPPAWRDLYLAVIVHQLLVNRNKPGSAMTIAMGIRRLAQAAEDTHPSAVTPEIVQQAYNAVLHSAQSGKPALDFITTVRTVIDAQKLADRPALTRFCVPYPSVESQSAQTRAETIRTRQNAHGGIAMRKSLAERKSSSQLPSERAFWELVRIVFTEPPRSFSDVIRFAAYKVQILMGFRIGETALLPLDWKRWREHIDADGAPAGKRGGISRSLMIRHFAEKQVDDERSDGLSLYENTQYVPAMFEDVLVETLDHIATLTAPLRDRLRHQASSGRIFPEHPEGAVIPAWEMYVRMTGNAVFSMAPAPTDLVAKYRKTYDPSLLLEVRKQQLENLLTPLSKFWRRPDHRDLPIRNSAGEPLTGPTDWTRAFVRVGDVEQLLRANRATKLSDTAATRLTDGSQIWAHDLLFILPIRNLIEGRNDGLLDTTLYAAIGRLAPADLINGLSVKGNGETIFARYGETQEDRSLTLTSHSLRHLQNAELFRLGVADTIITKKFNRRSVQQSYAYDHRSLAEDLESIDLPQEAEDALGDKAQQVFKLIKANRARGPIVDEFHRVTREYGEEAGFDYLNAEADGLHVTPYGLCVNSFTSDPCPKHLECFNGCLHLARTDVVDEQVQLERLLGRFDKVIATLRELPEGRRTAGWANQLDHALVRHANIVKALATKPGLKPFPDGRDLSLSADKKYGDTILDTMNRLRGLDD